jgi:hypothetical protein
MGATIAEQVLDVEFTVTDNITTATPNVAMQFKDIAGNDVSHPVAVIVYLTTDSAGQTLAADSTDTTEIAIGTDGTILAELVTDIMAVVVSEADGDLDMEITVVDTKTVYFNVVMPNGEVKTCTTALNYTS